MKTQLSLVELATQIQANKDTKRDFIADTRELHTGVVGEESKSIQLMVGNEDAMSITDHAHSQIASRLQIPKQYYDRLRTNHPDLLSHDINELFQREPERRMVRTLKGNVRAFMSDRYRVMDNDGLAGAILPILQTVPDLQIQSAALTETRMYMKCVFPRTQMEVKRGDFIQSGIVISNSEVGAGSLYFAPLAFRLECLNGLISEHYGQRKYHVGRAADEGEEAYEIYRDETLQADDKALWLKVQDVLRAAINDASFEKIVAQMQRATGVRLTGKIDKIVEVTAKKFGYTEDESGGILRHLIEGGDLTMYGLMNAITAQSQDVVDYDRATQLERDGGRLIELPRTDWELLAQAA